MLTGSSNISKMKRDGCLSDKNGTYQRYKKRIRRSRRLAKIVRFEQDVQYKKEYGEKTIRSLFSFRLLLELPSEMLSCVLSYLNAKELMNIRCVNKQLLNLVDNNAAIWSKVSFQNLWPTSTNEKELFRRGSDALNVESLIKLGLDHLYHYNLTAHSEKSEKKVQLNAMFAANYFRSMDICISPKKPLTWMLIRPPWSAMRIFCLKQAIFDQINKFKMTNLNGSPSYNLGKIMNMEMNNTSNGIDNLKLAADDGCSYGLYEQLILTKNLSTDRGSTLKWFRELLRCSSTGNKDATFELCQFLINNEKEQYLNTNQAEEICRNLFLNCTPSGIDRLETFQPKVNGLMRCILIDWLAEVAYMKDMSHQVLHAAVQYIDRYLMTRIIERPKLQLLGITCLLIAAKSHDDPRHVHMLTVRESSWLTDQTYQYEDVVKMMGEIMGTFKGDIWFTTSYDYLNILLSFAEVNSETKYLAHYLHDISLQFTSFGSTKPSLLAASVLYLANSLLKQGCLWADRLIKYTGFEVKDLVNCAALLHYKGFVCPAMRDDRDLPLESIKNRYLSDQMSCVASMTILTEDELQHVIVSSDDTLSCISNEPLYFTVIAEIDDTLNVSVKSIDYYGDCEYDNANSSFEDQSFCVGRSRFSSYHSVDDFSDDETTMDADSFTYYHKFDVNEQRKDNFTPIFHSASASLNNSNKNISKDSSFQFDFVDQHEKSIVEFVPDDSIPTSSKNSASNFNGRCLKRKSTTTVNSYSKNIVAKRTRSSNQLDS